MLARVRGTDRIALMPSDLVLDPATFSVERPILDRAAIAGILPHRDALALVDGIFHLDEKA